MRLSRRLRAALLSSIAVLGALAFAAGATLAQFGGGAVPEPGELMKVTVGPAKVRPEGHAQVVVTLHILKGWHVNANPPSNENAIATEISAMPAGGVSAGAIEYPPPKIEKLSFDPQPQLVWDGDTPITLPITAAAGATGHVTLKGKVRFQSCNDQVCLPPASIEFDLPVEIIGAGSASAGATTTGGAGSTTGTTAPADTTHGAALAPGAPGSFTTAPPAAGARGAAAAPDNPIARAIDKGGLTALLVLFLFGLALNLTPCVYPMLGVTVSIFGARRAAPPQQVIGYAALYVLGMALMYTTLGVVAALTGGLFGGFLQSPWVLGAVGVLLLLMSLSMFGMYEFTVPPQLMNKLGGATATSAAGVFLSGLVVGVFAAPCVGPAVVALLAVVGAKGDPWLGFTTFFTLSLGLGFPYLLLATFSNLLQRLPRSGEWMVWVKAIFGVILAGVGAFYLLLAFAPKLGGWVLPAALLLGGIYLGFIEKTKGRGPNFIWAKRGVGLAAVAIGAWLLVTTPSQAVAFRSADDQSLQAALATGRPVLLEFSADWCVPCHELERATFSDRGVIAASRDFHTFKVDLTRYDSPESERWRRVYAVRGVPTVIFLGADGAEIKSLRVEGFLAPEPFLERMKLASQSGARAERE
jgi:thiol:disulfide interchange protein DsbD